MVSPFLYMMFSVLSWSLFPLVSAWSIGRIGVYDYIFWTYAAGFAATSLIVFMMPKKVRAALPKLRDMSAAVYGEIFIGCLTVLMSFACLLISFSFITKSSATIIFEIWPIIALYIAPLLIQNRWEKIPLKDMAFASLAFIGLAFLVYPETANTLHRLLPLLGGIFMAIASVMKSRVSAALSHKDHPLASLLKVQLFFSAGVTLLALVFSLLLPGRHGVYDAGLIAALLFVGVGVHTFGNIAYTMALLRSARASIVALWYLMPVFAVFWLWQTGESTVSAWVILGGIFIITANLMTGVRAEKSIAYTSAILGLLGCGVYLYFIKGRAMEDYYQAVSVPIVFYAILVAFLMDRLIRSDKLEEDLAIDLLNYLDHNAAKIGKSAEVCRKHVIGMVTTNDSEAVSAHYEAVRNEDNKLLEPLHSQIDQLVLSKLRGTSFGEIFVLSIVGALTIIASTVYRPDNLIADGFAIMMTLTVTFIFFSMIDLTDKRREFYLEQSKAGRKIIARSATENLLGEKIISSVLILLIIAAFIGLLWMKHGFKV